MNTGRNILIIDDDPYIANLLLEILNDEGFNGTVCTDAREAFKVFRAATYDLILLDVMMPYIDGYELCCQIRTLSNLPIVFLSAKDSCIDKVTGLTIGADDYITKPFEPYEVTARVKAQLRRTSWCQESPNKSLAFEDISLHPQRHECMLNNIPLELTPTEFDILQILMEEPDVPHSIQEIFETIWNEEYDESGGKTVMVHIRRLRKKLNDANSSHPYITTIWGVGYKMRS